MKSHRVVAALACFCLSSFSGSLLAQDQYMGAAALLQKAAEMSKKGQDSVKEPPGESQKLKLEIQAFQKKAGGMPPAEAAKAWLGYLDRLDALAPTLRETPEADAATLVDLMASIPPPSAWEELAKAIEKRPAAKGKKQSREIGLRLFSHTLLNHPADQALDLAALEALAATLNREDARNLSSLSQQIKTILAQNSGDPESVVKAMEEQLQGRGQRFRGRLEVPDLVNLIGQSRAEALLRRALTNSSAELYIQDAEATEKLARKLALELVPQMKSAQWPLAFSLDSAALFEAMEKQFPEAAEAKGEEEFMAQRYDSGESSRQTARAYYLLGLIAAHRDKDAVALAAKLEKTGRFSLPANAIKSLERAGHTRAIHDFFREMLTQNPDAPFWDDYIPLAAKLGETEKMLELARTVAAREDLSIRKKSSIHAALYRALLAADKVDEGVKELRLLIARDKAAGPARNDFQEGHKGIELARIGFLVKNKDWAEEGVRAAREELLKSQKSEMDYEAGALAVELSQLLADQNRGPEAETLLMNSLAHEAGKKKESNDWSGEPAARKLLIALASIYHHAGRGADVLVLLDKSPAWGAKDLLEFYTESVEGRYFGGGHHAEPDPVGLFVASALTAQGRKEEAHKIIDSLLDSQGGLDPAYELLTQIDGDKAMTQLDRKFSQDQFEERPLIWKSILLQKAGKLEEAETVARKAISIDPSDGEQGPGRRMRAYAVLADIREARGDKNQAGIFRGAVKAIRLSETADRYYEAGLLKQAVKMYEDSLTLFADAYCIQSRLALRLSELGMHELAQEHYQRAYELMPESFGRVESHCFGCERAFDGQEAQGIAEKVFTTLAAKTPQKPQVHYLLGYLRQEQGRYKEALTHFREAVRLDPDYLNAWSHIQALSRFSKLSAADHDAVALNLIRLDPMNRHGGKSVEVTDLRALWIALEKAASIRTPAPASLLPLAASKVAVEKEESEQKTSRRDYQRVYGEDRFNEETMQPGKAILQNSMIRAAFQLYGGNGGQFGED